MNRLERSNQPPAIFGGQHAPQNGWRKKTTKIFHVSRTTLIVKVCNQFRNDNSTGEAYTVLSSQIKTSKEELEGELAMIRYVIEAIPILGFIGTVIGLIDAILESKGMLSINPAEKEASLFLITDAFGMAFGTTLVALLLSLILNQHYQSYLGRLDVFFSKTENYIVENLISRIFKDKH